MAERGITPSQTVGPFFAFALTPAEGGIAPLCGNDLLTEDAIGERIRIEGRVFDGEARPVIDALLEIWQTDGAGRHAGSDAGPLPNAAFKGFGRCATDRDGGFAFTTVKPGALPGPGSTVQAPHIVVGVFARGLLNRLVTRIYFPDEPLNGSDPVLALVPVERRSTLLARPRGSRDGLAVLAFDIRLQGPMETVFFAA